MNPEVVVHHHGKLVVDLHRSGRTLTMRVLEQGEGLRNACKHEVLLIAQCGNYNLSSEGVPELLSRSMLVRGMRTSGDDDESSLTYTTESAAISAESAFRAMIAAVNGKGEVKADSAPRPYHTHENPLGRFNVIGPGGYHASNLDRVDATTLSCDLNSAFSAGSASRQSDVDAVMSDYQDAATKMHEALTRVEALESENKALREAVEKAASGERAMLLDTAVDRGFMFKADADRLAALVDEIEAKNRAALALRTLGGEGGGN